MNTLWEQFRVIRPGWGDLVEIAIVAALVYRLLLLLKRTRAMQMLFGVGLLAVVYFLARLLNFSLIGTILETLFQLGAIALLVVFQPELRAALARLGAARRFRLFAKLQGRRAVDEVVGAAELLSSRRLGAIIVLENDVGLDDYARTGYAVEARVSKEMLVAVFAPHSPLHDGAVIIVGDRIRAAGAILPLTLTPLHDRSMGTRHRAALGLSEESDAIVVVVSEETSRVSVAHRGRLEVGVELDRLREFLAGTTVTPEPEPGRPVGRVPGSALTREGIAP